ncbi:MAG: hypothetical protein MJ187_00600 [Alphaproteobacteria bacterium]|nr:hypothetical protein [Alphaproteobacteria bacterium]
MISLPKILPIAFALATYGVHASPVPTTAGDNLTAFNSNNGLGIGNNWNAMVSGRSSATTAPEANFGNCNAIIMRCATPKCSSGGCTDMSVASSIVAGCVASKEECQKYGDELVNYIAAQLVANSTARANQMAADAQNSAAQMAAQQSAQQIQQMQQQMQQMQQEMAAQNQATVSQLQNALEEQKRVAAQAQAAAVAQATNPINVSDSQINAAQNGVSSDVLIREQISGQILSKIENAETQLKTLKAVMKTTFDYAGCDSTGSNCTGPKRVKKFKQNAMEFFDPYENVLDELYDALTLAQTVGVDLTNIYLMLNGTCNVWGEYVCSNVVAGKKIEEEVKEGNCRLIKLLNNEDDVKTSWLNPENGSGGEVRIACASEALETSTLFKNRRKASNIDIETLKRIIEQDSIRSGRNKKLENDDIVKYCAITSHDYGNLLKYTASKKLPDKICISESGLKSSHDYIANDSSIMENRRNLCEEKIVEKELVYDDKDNYEIVEIQPAKNDAIWSEYLGQCFCYDSNESSLDYSIYKCDKNNSIIRKNVYEQKFCEGAGGFYTNGECDCSKFFKDKDAFDRCNGKIQKDFK